MQPIYVSQTGAGSTRWVSVSTHMTPMNLSIAATVTGTVDFTVEYTYDDYWTWDNPGAAVLTSRTPTVWPDTVLVGATASGETTFNNPITAWRLTVNSGSGTVAGVGIQAGIAGN